MACENNNHKRFGGVFFAKNGCIACEAEDAHQRVKVLTRLLMAWAALSTRYELGSIPMGVHRALADDCQTELLQLDPPPEPADTGGLPNG